MQSLPARPRSDAVILSLLLFGFTLLTFWLATKNDFINFDDQVYLTHNEVVKRGLTWEGIRYAFTSGDVGNWHPVTWLSHLTDVQCFGMDAGKHHLVSVVLHALNAVLLFWVMRGLTGSLWASAFVAAAFGLHPLRVESVAWASERKDLLAAFFGFWAILFYQRFAANKAGGRKYRPSYALALVSQALSLMSKPMLVTLPCLLLLLDFWPLQRWQLFGSPRAGVPLRVLLAEKIPFLLLTMVSSIITLVVQAGAGAVATTQLFTLETRTSNAFIATVKYLQKCFWPTDLCPFYPYDLQPASTLIAWAVVLIGAVFLLSWLMRKRFPFVAVGWLWFVGLLVPVIGLVQVGSQSMADRYTYLPTIGIIIAVTWAVRQVVIFRPTIRWAVVIGTAVLLGRFGQLSQGQVLLWRDSETLFNHTLSVTKENAIAHESLALVLARRDAVKQAAWHFSETVRIWPNFSDAYSDFGLALSLQGKNDAALVYSRRAIELDPDSERFQYNLAKIYSRMGSNVLASAEFEKFVQRFPNSEAGTLSLAEILLADQKTGAAVDLLSKFAARGPASDEMLLALGHALLADKRLEEAMEVVRRVISRNSKNDKAHYQLGELLLGAGKPQDALQPLQTALSLRPVVEHHLMLADACSQLGDDAQAIVHYEKALELKADVAGTLNNLTWLLATTPQSALRNGKRAVELGEKACELTQQQEPFLLGTLAAAYAEAGRFDEAVATAQKAIKLAQATGKAEVVARNNQLLELYRAHQPYHEPAAVK